MGEFSADWLSVREPEDRAARNQSVLTAVRQAFTGRARLKILDIGCGTGSTMRTLISEFSVPQDWVLADYDETLLEQARILSETELLDRSCSVQFTQCDLTDSFDILDGDHDLITTSAFLDLVSEDWLAGFVKALAARGLPFYGALSYNGVGTIDPAHPQDDAVLTAFNHHQRTDKGFGPALGPDSAKRSAALFAEAGYEVITGPSDWNSQASERPSSPVFQRLLLEGWAQAAGETGMVEKDPLSLWLDGRMQAIRSGHCQVVVGHEDIFATMR